MKTDGSETKEYIKYIIIIDIWNIPSNLWYVLLAKANGVLNWRVSDGEDIRPFSAVRSLTYMLWRQLNLLSVSFSPRHERVRADRMASISE